MDCKLNISLPEETIRMIDMVIQDDESPAETHRDRSRFINQAVQYYIKQKTLTNLKEQLKEGAIQRAQRDLELAEEWYD
ncbi:MAG: hypothetical protein WBA07_18400 [Rivularia sp. (in: cyanobacteria)]